MKVTAPIYVTPIPSPPWFIKQYANMKTQQLIKVILNYSQQKKLKIILCEMYHFSITLTAFCQLRLFFLLLVFIENITHRNLKSNCKILHHVCKIQHKEKTNTPWKEKIWTKYLYNIQYIILISCMSVLSIFFHTKSTHPRKLIYIIS
jgi:hypothetical protein